MLFHACSKLLSPDGTLRDRAAASHCISASMLRVWRSMRKGCPRWAVTRAALRLASIRLGERARRRVFKVWLAWSTQNGLGSGLEAAAAAAWPRRRALAQWRLHSLQRCAEAALTWRALSHAWLRSLRRAQAHWRHTGYATWAQDHHSRRGHLAWASKSQARSFACWLSLLWGGHLHQVSTMSQEALQLHHVRTMLRRWRRWAQLAARCRWLWRQDAVVRSMQSTAEVSLSLHAAHCAQHVTHCILQIAHLHTALHTAHCTLCRGALALRPRCSAKPARRCNAGAGKCSSRQRPR